MQSIRPISRRLLGAAGLAVALLAPAVLLPWRAVAQSPSERIPLPSSQEDRGAMKVLAFPQNGTAPVDRAQGVDVEHPATVEPAAAGRAAEPAAEAGVAPGLPPLHEVLGPVFLLARPRVQEELKLTTEQRDKLKPVMAEAEEALRAALTSEGLTPENLPQRIQPVRERLEGKLRPIVESVLTQSQRERLGEIGLQQQGVFALADPNRTKALGLSDEERQKLQAALMSAQQRLETATKEASASGDPMKVRQAMLKARREQEERILATLTAEQLEHWKMMLGKPFSPDD